MMTRGEAVLRFVTVLMTSNRAVQITAERQPDLNRLNAGHAASVPSIQRPESSEDGSGTLPPPPVPVLALETQFVMVLESSVTAPFLAKALPSRIVAPVVMVMLVSA